jgi:hypothetical protein
MLAFGSLAEAWVLPVRKLKCQDAVIATVLSLQQLGFPNEIIEMITEDVWTTRRDFIWDLSPKAEKGGWIRSETATAAVQVTPREEEDVSSYWSQFLSWAQTIIEA